MIYTTGRSTKSSHRYERELSYHHIVPSRMASHTRKMLWVVALLLAVINAASGSIVDCCRQGQKAGDVKTDKPVCLESKIDYAAAGKVSKKMCRNVFMSCCRNTAEINYCAAGVQAAINSRQCTAGVELGGQMRLHCCNCCKRGELVGSQGLNCSVSQGAGIFCDGSFKTCCLEISRMTENSTIVEEKPTDKPVNIADCSTLGCKHQCTLGDNGRLVCLCPSGYRLKNDQKSCEDIDECAENPSTCDKGAICQNQLGSYICVKKPESKEKTCQSGFVLENDRCVDEDECASGSNKCGYTFCVNGVGTYSCVEECPIGYNAKGNICEDVDDCALGRSVCGSNYKCVNTLGSFLCELTSCSSGYQLKDGKCQDIDECTLGKHDCGKNYRCENTDGHYKCVLSSCKKGLQLSNGRCVDRNECSLNSGICGNGRCYNTFGSYLCSCFRGYHLDAGKKTCEDIDECKKSPGICESECINTVGSFTCACPSGYKSYADRCEDIDECSQSPKRCPTNHLCYNQYGKYTCIKTACPNKYYIRRSSYECRLYCPGNHGPCSQMTTQSIKWRADKFKKFVNPRGYKFTYVLRVSTYLRVQLSFKLKSGNENNEFFLQRTDEQTVNVINIKKLVGPKSYTLTMEADVSFRGKVINKFVYFIHIFVSKYSF